MLNNSTVKFAEPKEKKYRLTDGRGLYLLVTKAGKYWRLDYRIHGKRRTYAIGCYPDISLKEARINRREARQLIADGIDPVQHRQMVNDRQREAFDNSFGNVAEEWLCRQKKVWSKSHAKKVEGRLRYNLLPWLANRPIGEIEPPELLMVLRKIEDRGVIDCAHRCRTIAGQIFRYGIACGLCGRDPAADLAGALQHPDPKPMAAITDPVQAGGLMRAIRAFEGTPIIRCALRFMVLTFPRPTELRHCEWSEIIWPKAEWRIPAKKMKMKRPHIVPLPSQAIRVLQEIYPLTDHMSKYVFPNLRISSRCMGGSTINAALRRMGYSKDEMCAHGFRSMASTLLHENGWPHSDIELQLAHAQKDRVAAAYNRSQRLPERRKMMQWYADYLDELTKGDKRAVGHG
jgi:integrase